MSLPPAQAALLRAFTDDTRRGLEAAETTYGAMVAEHIARQLDLAASPAFVDWFRADGEVAGFDLAVTLAAIAGSDVVKPSRADATVRAEFGSVSGRVVDLAAVNGLRYGRAFATFGPVEDLYMHAEGGRAYTLEALLRRGQAIAGSGRLAHEVAEAIVGHDSFNAGFGRHRLKPLLVAAHGGRPEDYDYPVSSTPSGFLVQVLDRLEGAEAETMIRYVTEGVSDRAEALSDAIKVGVVLNAEFLAETLGSIRRDAAAALTPVAFRVLSRCPGMQSFEASVAALSRLVQKLHPPGHGDGVGYRLTLDSGSVQLDSLEAVRLFLPVGLRLARAEQVKSGVGGEAGL